MSITFSILLALHIIGASLVFGVWVANFKKGIVVPSQFYAALLQLITGFAMYFIQMSTGMILNHMMIGIKIVFALVITVAAYFGQKKYRVARAAGIPEEGKNVALAHTVGGLALVNILIAVFMTSHI